MNGLPSSIRPVLRPFARRLVLGQFLEIWPRWAAAGFLLAGLVTLICRLFFPDAGDLLPWIWLSPAFSLFPAIIICIKRAYRHDEIVALADSLNGGDGTLLTIVETEDPAWDELWSRERAWSLRMPQLRPWRQLWPTIAAAAFLIVTCQTPQRLPAGRNDSALAEDIAAELENTLAALKKDDLITPAEEKKLEEEIERIRKDALERVDSSSWEAADTFRENVARDLSEKQDAMKWAAESAASYAAASQAGGKAGAQADEMAKSIEKLAQSGMLADAPPELQKLLGGQQALAGGKVQLPADPASMRRLSELLSQHLDNRNRRFGNLAALGKEFGRFDPSEFPLFCPNPGLDSNGEPGAGGINRGRGDAPLTWGRESLPFDRFKAVALPPGFVRSPDDWAPLAELPGAPKESPQLSMPLPAQQYLGTAGQAAWRRTLAPRHHSAVRKYFDNSPSTQRK